jgi:hypothetical protein
VNAVATGVTLLAKPGDQLPEDVGKAGPLGLLLVVLLLIAAALLVRSMTTHLKRIPKDFDSPTTTGEFGPIPDDAAELLEPAPGSEVLDRLRRQPRAIEPPRVADDGPGESDQPR